MLGATEKLTCGGLREGWETGANVNPDNKRTIFSQSWLGTGWKVQDSRSKSNIGRASSDLRQEVTAVQ